MTRPLKIVTTTVWSGFKESCNRKHVISERKTVGKTVAWRAEYLGALNPNSRANWKRKRRPIIWSYESNIGINPDSVLETNEHLQRHLYVALWYVRVFETQPVVSVRWKIACWNWRPSRIESLLQPKNTLLNQFENRWRTILITSIRRLTLHDSIQSSK